MTIYSVSLLISYSQDMHILCQYHDYSVIRRTLTLSYRQEVLYDLELSAMHDRKGIFSSDIILSGTPLYLPHNNYYNY